MPPWADKSEQNGDAGYDNVVDGGHQGCDRSIAGFPGNNCYGPIQDRLTAMRTAFDSDPSGLLTGALMFSQGSWGASGTPFVGDPPGWIAQWLLVQNGLSPAKYLKSAAWYGWTYIDYPPDAQSPPWGTLKCSRNEAGTDCLDGSAVGTPTAAGIAYNTVAGCRLGHQRRPGSRLGCVRPEQRHVRVQLHDGHGLHRAGRLDDQGRGERHDGHVHSSEQIPRIPGFERVVRSVS